MSEELERYNSLYSKGKRMVKEYDEKREEKEIKFLQKREESISAFKSYSQADPNAVTFGSVNENRNFSSLRGLIHALGYPRDPHCLKLRKLAFSQDGYSIDTLHNLNSFANSLLDSSKFVKDPESLAYFESIYFGVKESLGSGVFAKLRKKENEKHIHQTLSNLEDYILKSREYLSKVA